MCLTAQKGESVMAFKTKFLRKVISQVLSIALIISLTLAVPFSRSTALADEIGSDSSAPHGYLAEINIAVASSIINPLMTYDKDTGEINGEFVF
jgi:hypothetical protein